MKIIKRGTIFIDASGRATASNWELDGEGEDGSFFVELLCVEAIKALLNIIQAEADRLGAPD